MLFLCHPHEWVDGVDGGVDGMDVVDLVGHDELEDDVIMHDGEVHGG